LKTGLRKWLHVSLPGLVIFISTRFLFAHTPPVNTLHPENFIDLFSNPFHIGWYPFSILTLVFFAEFKFLPSVLKAISILILPIYFQLLIAGDLERMTAYAFIVLIPSTILWLNRMTTHYFLKFKILISALFLVLYFQFTRHTQIVFGLSVFFILANTLISANIAKKTVKNGVTQ
jgi:hypothetical protein